jgi:urea transport system substrate-binding protein
VGRTASGGRPWFDAHEGPVQIDPATQHTVKTVRISKIVEGRHFEVAYTSPKPIPPVPYPNTRTREEWAELVFDLHVRWAGRWEPPR